MLERKMQVSIRHGQPVLQIYVVGPLGAIEFHFVAVRPQAAHLPSWSYEHWPFDARGVEMHKRVPADQANRDTCLILGEPCYHDGSSLIASEKFMPAFLSGGTDAVWPLLEEFYDLWLGRREENEAA
jgi:hypothetical protein